MTYNEAKIRIRAALPDTEILCQLAEECTELAQAALKLRRVLDGRNPTPVKPGEANDAVLEELGDVLNCADLLYLLNRDAEARYKKMLRWAKRLAEKEKMT